MNSEENIVHYPNSIETRVALLEMSLLNINQTLSRIENEIKDLRQEIRIDIKEVKREMKNDTRWLLTVIAAIAAVMAHGFHWF